MPALAVQRRRLARQEFGPHFEPRDVGCKHFCTARSVRLTLGQDRRHQDGAGVAVEADVVIVQHVGGYAINEGRAFNGAPRARGDERGRRRLRRIDTARAQLAIDKTNFWIARSGDQNAEAVGNSGARNRAAFRWDLA